MRNCLRCHVGIATLLVITLYGRQAHSGQNQWDLHIELAKNQYVLHEPIWLDIRLTNVSAGTQRTNGLTAPNHREFKIDLKDSLGNAVVYHGPQYSLAVGPGKLLLGPGEQDFGSFDVVRLFQFWDRGSGYSLLEFFPFIPTGVYTVQVYYEGAVSNVLTFTVGESSDEAREVLELIEQASVVWNQKDREPSTQLFREILRRFPNSPFSEMCYYLSEVFSREAQEERRLGNWDFRSVHGTMLENFPNSGDASSWIAGITFDMDADAKREFLNEVAEANAGTRAAKYARVMLNQMSKQKGGD